MYDTIMKLSHSFILLSSSTLLQSANAQNATTLTTTNCTDVEAAAATCTTTHNCTPVVDDMNMNVSLDCSDIKEEHCELVEGCTECKEEIYALYDCKYGASCGMGIEAACLEENHDEEEQHDDEDDHGHIEEEGVDDHHAGEEKDDEHHDDQHAHHDDHGHDDHHDDEEEKKEDDHHDDDHDDDHHGHDDHGHEGDDHSDEDNVMALDSPSSASIRGVVAVALAIAAGSMIIA